MPLAVPRVRWGGRSVGRLRVRRGTLVLGHTHTRTRARARTRTRTHAHAHTHTHTHIHNTHTHTLRSTRVCRPRLLSRSRPPNRPQACPTCCSLPFAGQGVRLTQKAQALSCSVGQIRRRPSCSLLPGCGAVMAQTRGPTLRASPARNHHALSAHKASAPLRGAVASTLHAAIHSGPLTARGTHTCDRGTNAGPNVASDVRVNHRPGGRHQSPTSNPRQHVYRRYRLDSRIRARKEKTGAGLRAARVRQRSRALSRPVDL